MVAFGIISYRSLPKELSPEVVIPTILVQTIYPGNPPVDIENLITRPLEKEIETVKGLKELRSTSSQDYSLIFAEFNTNVEIKDALREVKDAVDRAQGELPNDLLSDPTVDDIDFSEFPIININLSGDYSIDELKFYAEYLEDEFESIPEVSKVELKGVNEKEIKINVDRHKLEANKISFTDIEMAIASENLSVSGGEIKLNNTRMSLRTVGEFKNIQEIGNIIVKHDNGNIVYLKDIAEIIDGYEDPKSYARLDGKPVVSLQVVKKSGENLLQATAQIFDILETSHQTKAIPDDLSVSITNDQSQMIRTQLSNLENSMIMGVIFVVLVLFYFLGTRNALFVGMAIPLSMFLSFVIMGVMDSRLNMIVLFSLILALGMLVDNAIVVVENIYRYVSMGEPANKAARKAVGEIALPIISSTATTLAAFFPLIFWSGITGEFMKWLPITLIIVLTSSLFVALVILPVFSSSLIKAGEENERPNKKRVLLISTALLILSAPFYLTHHNTIANLLAFPAVIGMLHVYIFKSLELWFRNELLKKIEKGYLKILHLALNRNNALIFIGGTMILMLGTIVFYFGIRQPKFLFFPDNDPKYINIIAELPIGTDIAASDSLMYNIESYTTNLLSPNKTIIESFLTTVGTGAKGEMDWSVGETPNKGLLTITFVDFEYRNGVNTSTIQKMLSDSLLSHYPGVNIAIEKNQMGPPAGRPVNIEVSGKDYNRLLQLTDSIQNFIESKQIAGIEGLNIDLNVGKPELIVTVDRDRARRFGISTGQVAATIRTALFGKEISDFKVDEEEYPIQLRFSDKYRYSLSSLINQQITFRSASTGRIVQVPISSVADISYSTTYGAVKRKDRDRVVTLYSNVLEGYNPTNVNTEIKEALQGFTLQEGYKFSFTGEQQEQEESMAFLVRALLIAISLILLILVTQFNSVIKPLIILASVLFSTIGVFGGLGTFDMNFVVVMTGIGIVSLAGVVVNNAIVLIDYTILLERKKREQLNLEQLTPLPPHELRQCIIEAGQTRLRPVLLTAITTILGLLPLAVGMNINFETLLSDFNPQFSIGGDMVIFWGPISWTIIYGLAFATFLTLIIVPSMYYVFDRLRAKTKAYYSSLQSNL